MYFVSALSNLKYKDNVSAGRKHEATGESPCTLPPGPNLEARLYLMPHLFLFSCGKEDNNGSVALGVLACHLTAKGGHISEWCGWETTRSALHDWMARL